MLPTYKQGDRFAGCAAVIPRHAAHYVTQERGAEPHTAGSSAAVPARACPGAPQEGSLHSPAHRDARRLSQSLPCPSSELVTLTNIIQSLDILGEQSAHFINPANFRSAHAVFWLLSPALHYGAISLHAAHRAPALPGHGAYHCLQTLLTAGIF